MASQVQEMPFLLHALRMVVGKEDPHRCRVADLSGGGWPGGARVQEGQTLAPSVAWYSDWYRSTVRSVQVDCNCISIV